MNMAAGFGTIVIGQGETLNKVFTWLDGNGVAINLTGFTARLLVLSPLTRATLIELNTTNGGLTLGGVAGTFTATLAGTTTALWTLGNYRFDLWAYSSSGYGGTATQLEIGLFIVTEAEA